MKHHALPRSMLFAFSLPAVMQGFTHAPEAIVQGIYAKYLGLPLTALATALLVTRMFDAITYPLIGYLSDRTYKSSGSRKPWIIAGTIVTMLGLWYLYRPPVTASVWYFGIWLFVTYIGWKLTEIPYSAWSLTLTSDYAERARIQMWRGIALIVGTLVFFAVPICARAAGWSNSSEMDLRNLALTAVVVAACVPLMNLYSIVRVPNGLRSIETTNSPDKERWRDVARSVLRNKPLIHLLSAAVPVVLLSGMANGSSYLFIDSYLRLSDKFPTVMLVATLMSIVGMPVWGWLCMRFERHRVCAICLLLTAASYLGLGTLPVGEKALAPLLFLYPGTVFFAVALLIAVPAMIGDAVDHGRLQFGEDRAGMYSAVYAFLIKSVGGVAAALGLALAGWFGFDATSGAQSAAGIFGIHLVSAWLPAMGIAMGGLVLWSFPIDKARLAEIHRELEKRDNRL